MISTVGQMVRDARRAGTLRGRSGVPLPVFRSQLRGQPFRIITKPASGLRHEIMEIEPEMGEASYETGSAAPQPSQSSVASTSAAPTFWGIDAGSVDGNRNPGWTLARDKAGIRFAILRATWGTWEDPDFKREWPRMKDAGLVRGGYLFLRYGKGKLFDPIAQAKAFIRVVGPLAPGDLPPSLDVEFPGKGRASTGLTAQQALDITRAAWKVLKDHYGVAPIIYTSWRVWHEDLNDLAAPDLVESPLWLAGYGRIHERQPVVQNAKAFATGRFDPPVPPPWGDKSNWWIHQYQGDARGLPGFHQVDMNRFHVMGPGATGNRVKWVQRRLGVAATGTFDQATAQALRAFKQRNGLPATDLVGPRTFAFLCWLVPAGRSDSQGEFEDRYGGGSGEFEYGGASEAEFELEAEEPTAGQPSAVRARILWPALGFPAVVKPGDRPSGSNASLRDGDATKCICVLVLSDKRQLTSQDAANNLRCVAWSERGRRRIAANTFAPGDIVVRSDTGGGQIAMTGRMDGFGAHLRFGGNARGEHGIVACLADRVRRVYRDAGLAYLHEIRVSESATARLRDGQYHLFWNNAAMGDAAPSDEMSLLVAAHARPARAALGKAWEKDRDFLIKEYMYEYGGLHAPYNRSRGGQIVAAEILHPLFINRSLSSTLNIGHVTDTHVDVRADVYEHNLDAAKASGTIKPPTKGMYDNFNRSFTRVYDAAKQASDVLLLTGDLIDYGRGFWGQGRAGQLQQDGLYHADRNWFLFYYLLASGVAYRRPAYTILGNHDWRLNPYPPFSPGATKPNEMLHDHARLTSGEQRKILEAMHGPGFNRGYSYTTTAESAWQLAREQTGTALKTFGKMLGQTHSLDVRGYPTETSVDSIAWYLLAINPFLDYAFTLPGRQSILMLDWARTEDVLFDDVTRGEKWGYDPFDPGSAAGTPRPSSSLSDLQQRLIADFTAGPSRAKVIGVHAPPIGPYSDWYNVDLFTGRKTYKNPRTARGPSGGHPLFANRPEGAPYGMTAERGSLVKGRERFIKAVSDPRSGVRLVLSGHIHRNGLYLVHPATRDIYVSNPKDIVREIRLKGALLVRGVTPNLVRGSRPPAVTPTPEGRQGPLYVTTTSAGPRGSFEDRALTDQERDAGKTTEPGWARLELRSDGSIQSVEFREAGATAVQLPAPSTAQREIAVGE